MNEIFTTFANCKQHGIVYAKLPEMLLFCKAGKVALPATGQVMQISGETFRITRKGGGLIPLYFECLKLSTVKFNDVFGVPKAMTTVSEKRKLDERRRRMMSA